MTLDSEERLDVRQRPIGDFRWQEPPPKKPGTGRPMGAVAAHDHFWRLLERPGVSALLRIYSSPEVADRMRQHYAEEANAMGIELTRRGAELYGRAKP